MYLSIPRLAYLMLLTLAAAGVGHLISLWQKTALPSAVLTIWLNQILAFLGLLFFAIGNRQEKRREESDAAGS